MAFIQPVTATPVREMGFPKHAPPKTVAEVLRRLGMAMTQTTRGEFIAVRMH